MCHAFLRLDTLRAPLQFCRAIYHKNALGPKGIQHWLPLQMLARRELIAESRADVTSIPGQMVKKFSEVFFYIAFDKGASISRCKMLTSRSMIKCWLVKIASEV